MWDLVSPVKVFRSVFPRSLILHRIVAIHIKLCSPTNFLMIYTWLVHIWRPLRFHLELLSPLTLSWQEFTAPIKRGPKLHRVNAMLTHPNKKASVLSFQFSYSRKSYLQLMKGQLPNMATWRQCWRSQLLCCLSWSCFYNISSFKK